MRWLSLFLLLALPASAQIVTPAFTKPVLIFSSASLQGNGADTTEDALSGYSGTVQLVNTGDVVHIVARGVSAGSTDSKSIRMKIGGTTACSVANNAAGNVTWYLDCWIVKTGANGQTAIFFSNNLANNSVNSTNAPNVSDGGALTVSMTAQNATAGTANSIQVQMAMAQYFPAQ